MERRHLAPSARHLAGDDAGSRPTKLLLVGTDSNGNPIYAEVPCVSNDNPSPYKWECDEVSPLEGAVETTQNDAAGNAVGLFCPGSPASSNGNGDGGSGGNEVVVPYVYEVETFGASGTTFLPKLEEQILMNLAGSMMGCLKDDDEEVRRALKERYLDGDGYEVVGIRSSPEDVEVTEGPCSVSDDTGADGCFLLDGKITLVLNPPSAPAKESATDAAQANLQAAMEDDALLDPEAMPEVVKVRYLADTYDEYAAGFTSAGGTDLGVGSGTPGGSGEGSGSGWWGAIAGAAGAALLVMLAALLFVRRRRRQQERADRRLASGHDLGWGWDDDIDVRDSTSVHAALLAGRMGAGGERVLYVSNLSEYTSEEQVRSLFEQHGTVCGCFVPAKGALDKQDSWSDDGDDSTDRYALLSMPARTEAENLEAQSAIDRIDGMTVGGHVLSVQEVTTLYVGNLSDDTTETDVRALFETYGTVIGCAIPADRDASDSGEDPNGRFALVTMPTVEAEAAMAAIHGTEVDGQKLTVRDTRRMHNGTCHPGNGLALAALAVGATGAASAAICRPFNAAGNENVTLYVGPLSPEATEDGIRRVFEQYGTVIDCTMPPVEEGMERYALVTMPAADAERAMNALDGVEDDGLVLRVREARPMAMGIDDASIDSSDFNYSADSQDEEGTRLGVGAIAGFMAAPFMRRKVDEKSVAGNKAGDDGLDAIIAGIDGSQDERNYVIDPEGAFHLGNHHYTKEGVRYFSPLCEQCLAYRASAEGVVALHALDDRDDSVDGGRGPLSDSGLSFDLEAAKKFTDFDSNDLGRYHSSMHVRHCKSTTCVTCRKAKEVFFVKARREKDESLV